MSTHDDLGSHIKQYFDEHARSNVVRNVEIGGQGTRSWTLDVELYSPEALDLERQYDLTALTPNAVHQYFTRHPIEGAAPASIQRTSIRSDNQRYLLAYRLTFAPSETMTPGFERLDERPISHH